MIGDLQFVLSRNQKMICLTSETRNNGFGDRGRKPFPISEDIGKSLWTKEDGSHDGEKFMMYQEPIYEINTMSSDNSTFRNELACLTTT